MMVHCPICKTENSQYQSRCSQCDGALSFRPDTVDVTKTAPIPVRVRNDTVRDHRENLVTKPSKHEEFQIDGDHTYMNQSVTRPLNHADFKDTLVMGRNGGGRGEGCIVGSLLSFDSEPTGELHPVREGRNLIGAASTAGIQVRGPHISRKHALIMVHDGSFALSDTNSTNGTMVNGERLNDVRLLEAGDLITLGTTRFYFFPLIPPQP